MTFWQDVRYSFRAFVRQPGFTAVAVLTLALGIGANTAIFSVVNAVLLQPLPYRDADRLMQIAVSLKEIPFYSATPPKFHFWREQSQSFEALTAYGYPTGVNLSGDGEPEYVESVKISRDFLSVFAVQPARGRGFTAEEDRPGGAKVAIITDRLWQQKFGTTADILGKTISLDSQPHTIVGVLPSGFHLMTDSEVLTPLQASPTGAAGDYNYAVIGRLKPGVTEAQSRAEMQFISENYRAAFPKQVTDDETIAVRPYKEGFVKDIRPALQLLLGAVGFVLLIACANVANLQLVRAAARRREMAVRSALGASWLRVTRQLVTEGVMLALAGGLAGLLLAMWGVELLTAALPESLVPRAGEIGFNLPVLAFTLLTSLITGVVFALAPAFEVRRLDISKALKDTSSRGTAGRGKIRRTLVVVEIALSLVLLVSAGLLIRTFISLQRVDSGFEAKSLLTFKVRPSGQPYATAAQTTEFHRRVLERLRTLPGVEAAAVTSNLPLDQPFRMPIWVSGKTESVGSIQFRTISPDYFRVLRSDVKQGREFLDSDKAGTEPVAIVNEAFARQFLADADPLRQQISYLRPSSAATAGGSLWQIVGVVGDVKQFSLRDETPPMVFIPASQVSDDLQRVMRRFLPTVFAIRTTVEPLTLTGAVKHLMLAEDSQLAVTGVRSMEQILAHSISAERFYMLLLAVFACIGLTIAAVGLYGAMSFVVAQRTQEIGIRMALGAQRADVLRMILRQGMSLTVAGIALGFAGTIAVSRLIKTLLFGVGAVDAITLITVAFVLMASALIACYLPARRATKVDPLVALRYE